MHAIEAALRKSDMPATDVRQTRATDAAHSSPAHETGCPRTTRSCTLRCWADFYANSCKVCTVKLSHSRGSLHELLLGGAGPSRSRPLCVTVPTLRAFARHGEMKYCVDFRCGRVLYRKK